MRSPSPLVIEARGVRDVKDAMSQEILRDLEAAGIGLASATIDVVGVPPLRTEQGAVVAGGHGTG